MRKVKSPARNKRLAQKLARKRKGVTARRNANERAIKGLWIAAGLAKDDSPEE